MKVCPKPGKTIVFHGFVWLILERSQPHLVLALSQILLNPKFPRQIRTYSKYHSCDPVILAKGKIWIGFSLLFKHSRLADPVQSQEQLTTQNVCFYNTPSAFCSLYSVPSCYRSHHSCHHRN